MTVARSTHRSGLAVVVAVLCIPALVGACGEDSVDGAAVPSTPPLDEVGPPVVVGSYHTHRMPDPDCSPRADGEPGIGPIEVAVTLEEGLRDAIRSYGLPHEGLLHVPELDGPRRRVYVAIRQDQVAAVVQMTRFDSADGAIRAWIAERAIRCPRLLAQT